MHFSLEWFLLELSWNVASYRGSVYTQFDDEGSAAGNLEIRNRALIITLPLFSIGSCRCAVPWNSSLLLFWCQILICVPGLRYAELKTMSMYTRASQKPEVSQKDVGVLVDGELNTSHSVPLQQVWLRAAWAALGAGLLSGWEKWFLPSAQHWGDTSRVCAQIRAPSTGESPLKGYRHG